MKTSTPKKTCIPKTPKIAVLDKPGRSLSGSKATISIHRKKK